MNSYHYRFIIEGLNFKLNNKDQALTGFYTTLFIEASTYEDARAKVALLILNRLSENNIIKNDSFMFKPFLGISKSYRADSNIENNEGFTFFDMSLKDSLVSTGKSFLASLGLLKQSE
ncbi:hypothetical protein [Brumicola pallidula]|jgi:hypothetical protein|uniref:hypothetical protein n=1 Tax=Brumicola pallidula TaxID=56807 RepID=UPI000479DAB8|nr:hypothetical protein [Glaciecola pallidula]